MGKLLKGVVKFTVAAAAIGGVCYAFKDQIKESKIYKEYDVDTKLNKVKTTIKEKMPKVFADEADIVDEDDIAFKLLGFLKERYPKQLMERFKLDEEILQGETLAIMDQIGKNRGCLLKGGRVDYSKVSKGVILDLRQGKIGRITLE